MQFYLTLSTDSPILNLTLGANLNPNNIRQGGDVYFECQHIANPPVQKITWYREASYIIHVHNYHNN